MGFRRITDFNVALLDKQAWRVLNMPDLLSSRILLARYFPQTLLLSSTVGCRPSFVWRSIWGSKWVLEKGCKWIIGDGRKVRIWEDPWLGKPPSHRVVSVRKEDSECTFVADLIDHASGCWKEEVVGECFLPFEDQEVMFVPLSSIPLEDELVWSYEKLGEYSVKSGYNFITFFNGIQGEGCSSSEVPKLWRMIWELAVPPKARVFIWRLSSGALPTVVGLHRRIDSIPPWCNRCERLEESSVHRAG